MGISGLITIEIDTSKFEKKIGKFIAVLPTVMEKTVVDIMEYVEVQANQNLDQSLIWGHGVDTSESIKNNWKKEITEKTRYRVKGTLSNLSPHALYQEIGGIIKTEITRPEGMFPIGKSQGNVVAFSPTFELAQGKYYLQTAVYSHIPEITEIAKKNIGTAIINL